MSNNPVFRAGALPRGEMAGSPSAARPGMPGGRRPAVVRAGAAGFCALAYLLAGCSGAHYGMTTCPAANLVGRAAKAPGVKLLPNSAPAGRGSATPTDWTCNYVPADQYQRWLDGSHNALSVEIYLFPKKIVSKRLLGNVDGHAALQSGKARVDGQITLAGQEAPVAVFRTGYGAWTGQLLPDGSYSALAIYLSSGQAPRTAAGRRQAKNAASSAPGCSRTP